MYREAWSLALSHCLQKINPTGLQQSTQCDGNKWPRHLKYVPCQLWTYITFMVSCYLDWMSKHSNKVNPPQTCNPQNRVFAKYHTLFTLAILFENKPIIEGSLNLGGPPLFYKIKSEEVDKIKHLTHFRCHLCSTFNYFIPKFTNILVSSSLQRWLPASCTAVERLYNTYNTLQYILVLSQHVLLTVQREDRDRHQEHITQRKCQLYLDSSLDFPLSF